MSSLAIIPARGGSKRIPRKNVKIFCGKPIIGYSIESAIQSRCFDEVMVSTDDQEIAEIAHHCGAKTPFIRSKENSNDSATLAEVICEVLDNYSKTTCTFDQVCCILPTAPLLQARDLSESRQLLRECPGVFSAVKFAYPIWRALQKDGDIISMIWPQFLKSRSQDLPQAYHDAGMFYWVDTKAFFQEKSLFLKGAKIWELPETRVQDIDSPTDWDIAQIKFTHYLSQMELPNE